MLQKNTSTTQRRSHATRQPPRQPPRTRHAQEGQHITSNPQSNTGPRARTIQQAAAPPLRPMMEPSHTLALSNSLAIHDVRHALMSAWVGSGNCCKRHLPTSAPMCIHTSRTFRKTRGHVVSSDSYHSHCGHATLEIRLIRMPRYPAAPRRSGLPMSARAAFQRHRSGRARLPPSTRSAMGGRIHTARGTRA